MLLFKNIFFFALTTNVVSGLVVPRANDPLTSLKIVANDTCKCVDLVVNFTNQKGQADAIQKCVSQLKTDLKQAIADVQASPVLTDAQCKEILAYIVNNLIPCLKKLLQAIKDKKEAFTAAGIKSVILQNLKDLRDLFKALLVALYQKLPDSCKPQYTTYQNQILQLLDDAVSYYS